MIFRFIISTNCYRNLKIWRMKRKNEKIKLTVLTFFFISASFYLFHLKV